MNSFIDYSSYRGTLESDEYVISDLQNTKMLDLNLNHRLFFDIDRFDVVNLMAMLLHYSISLTEWDRLFREGKFIPQLAKLITEQIPDFAFIFERVLPLLH